MLSSRFVACRCDKCSKFCIRDQGFVHPKAGDGDGVDRGCVRKQICIATHLKAAAIDQDHVCMVSGDSDRELGWLGWRLTSLCAKENQSYRDGLPTLLFVHIDGV